MEKIEQHIRQTMDKRLAALKTSDECKMRIRQRIMQEEDSPSIQPMHRLPMRAATVFAVVLLIGSIAAAAMVNVFDLYSNMRHGEVALFASLAKHSELENTQSAVIHDEHIGTSTASITNGYYDGTALFLGFTIENAGYAAAYTPSEQELASAEILHRLDYPYTFLYYDFLHKDLFTQEEYALIDAFEEAIEQGKPYGIIVRWICEDAHYTSDDTRIHMSWFDDYFADFDAYRIIESGSVPEELLNLNELPVSVTLKKRTSMMYFDGAVFYIDSWDEPLDSSIAAVIKRTERKLVRYEGSGECRDTALQASLDLSQVEGTLTLSADNDLFKKYGYGRKLNFELTDEQGRAFDTNCRTFPDSQTCVISYIGNMTHPEQLNLRIYEEVYYGDYEMIPFGTAAERSEVIYETQIPLVSVQ